MQHVALIVNEKGLRTGRNNHGAAICGLLVFAGEIDQVRHFQNGFIQVSFNSQIANALPGRSRAIPAPIADQKPECFPAIHASDALWSIRGLLLGVAAIALMQTSSSRQDKIRLRLMIFLRLYFETLTA